MSRLYDGLRRRSDDESRPQDLGGTLDLFAYAAKKSAETAPPAPAPEPEPSAPAAPPKIAPVDEPAPTNISTQPVLLVEPDEPPPPEEGPHHLYRRGIESDRPITGVLDTMNRSLGVGRSRGRSRAALTAAVVAVVVLVVGFFTTAVVRSLMHARPKREARAPAKPVPVEPAARKMPAPKPVAPLPAVRAEPPAKPSAPKTLALSAKGAVVRSEGAVHIVTFESGIFTGSARLGSAGRSAIATLSKQIKPFGARVRVSIIGCTDNVPMNPGARYEDNTELGLARAEEVKKVMQKESGLADSTFTTMSYGERWAPYPNDTPENREKNRTVVLRISIKP